MVSIIIPVYNVEKYLVQCIESVFSQTYRELEIILVDDGSTDRSGRICDDYAEKDSRVTVIHKENSGNSDARNIGMDIAHGEYIYFLDSDDYIRKDAIELLLDCAEKEGADIVGFSAKSFSENGAPIPDDLRMKHHYDTAPGVEILIERFENTEWFGSIPLYFFKSEFLKREKLRFRKGIFYEDMLFSGLAQLRQCKAAILDQTLYYYRRSRKGSIMTMTKRPEMRNFKSFLTCAGTFIAAKKKNAAGSVAEKGFDYLIRYSFNRCVMTFCDMKRQDRIRAKPAMKRIRREVNNIRCVDCRKLKLTLMFPRLWFIYYRGIRKFAKVAVDLLRYSNGHT